MTISSIPPPRTLTLMRAAPASSAFSTSSLTIDAGRSTTSPAAIWAATRESNTRMGMAYTPASEHMFAGIVYHRTTKDEGRRTTKDDEGRRRTKDEGRRTTDDGRRTNLRFHQ